MKNEPIITISHVSKVYSIGMVQTIALSDVSFTIGQGEYVSVMGPSGSGKSTLMHIIGLLDSSFEGKYHLNDQAVRKLKGSKLSEIRGKEIGFVFQQFNLLPRTTVMQNVLMPTTYHPGHDDEVRALKMIKKVGLIEKISSRTNQLSGGQVQRVAIARALMMNPSILLADEPTGNLDSSTAKEIMGLLAEINRQGTTIVLITHEEDIAAYAKKIIRLRDGRIERDKK